VSGHDRYVSSFCFLLNALALPQMRRLMDEATSVGALIDRLAGRSLGRGHPSLAAREHSFPPRLWGLALSRPPASCSDSELLRKKACCVYFENRLSAQLAAKALWYRSTPARVRASSS
jgi:hypothetical protein